MTQSLAQNHIHLIFSTKDRIAYLQPDLQKRLFPYLKGICHSLDSPSIQVGGFVDHVHILFRLSKNHALSEIIGKIKGESSRWLNKQNRFSIPFSWQAGYGAFSVSQSQVDAVIRYIANQAKHHEQKSFKEEFVEFLEKYEVVYDEKYLWD